MIFPDAVRLKQRIYETLQVEHNALPRHLGTVDED